MKKIFFIVYISFFASLSADHFPIDSHTIIVGGGIVGAFESYYAYKDAEKNGKKIAISVYEKGDSFFSSGNNTISTNTACNLVPCLTFDEIIHVVPAGSELVQKLSHHFSTPQGIRVDDIPNLNDSPSAIAFKEAAINYGLDKNRSDKIHSLFQLGKKSMQLWQQLYEDADVELKTLLRESNFNPCHEVELNSVRRMHNGYQLELMYEVPDAASLAATVKKEYEQLGYNDCALLSPDEIVALDPYLKEFCAKHSEVDSDQKRVWKSSAAALWRPAGSIETRTFLPKFYAYLAKVMGTYKDKDNQIQDCFKLHFGKEVTAITLDSDLQITGLEFRDKTTFVKHHSDLKTAYIFCPGESVGTLQRLGFSEPAHAGFAGTSLVITMDVTDEIRKKFHALSLSMGVQKGDVMLAWQSRCKEDTIVVGAGGAKAFYGDVQPTLDDEFAKNRTLLQLNAINDLFPDLLSIACEYDTKGKMLTADDLSILEKKGYVKRWVGRRAVAYDGYPTLGALYHNGLKIKNGRCTTHLGSGGVSFAPAVVLASRCLDTSDCDPLLEKVLKYGDSRR